jgi:tetratricopeptide (TPR) repeat protein
MNADQSAAPPTEPDAGLDELLDGIAEKVRAGEPVDVEALARAHPGRAGELRRMLPAMQVLADLDASCRPGGPGDPSREVSSLGALGDFRLLREVGRGGMGVVYEAEQISLGRRVALKVLPLAATMDPRYLQRFHNEARAAAALHHPNIVPVYAVGQERGVHFYAMQFIDGRTLADLVAERRPGAATAAQPTTSESAPPPAPPDTAPAAAATASTLPAGSGPAYFRRVAELGVQAAEALEHAHRLGVVHRDVKPANLMLDAAGRLWVTDFGLARLGADGGLTVTGDLLGTLRYMSPEQALAKHGLVDHRTDVYALGVTLYELLALRPAVDGKDRGEILQRIAADEPKPPRRLERAIPGDLETVVLKAMAKEPAERYATAQELADDLRRVLEDKPIRAKRPSLAQRARKWSRRHRAVVWSVAVCLLLTVVGLAAVAGWRLRERAERLGRTAEAVEAALAESHERQRESRVPEALEAGRKAKAALDAGEGSPELRRRVRERLRDLEMLAKVESIHRRKGAMRESWGSVSVLNTWESYSPKRPGKTIPREPYVRIDDELTTAFEEYGIPVEQLDPREAGEQIRNRSISVELAAALHDWATFRRGTRPREDTSWKHLLAVAQAADHDEWRTRLRDAVEKKDRDALEELADQDAALALPVVSQMLLVDALEDVRAKEKRLAFLRKAQRKNPGEFWLNLDLAQSLFWRPGKGDAAEAIRFYAAALAARPRDPLAQMGLAGALWAKGDLDEAIAAYKKAIDLDPDLFLAHLGLGDVLEEKGLYGEAIAAYEQAIRIRPRESSAHINLGVTFAKQKKFDEAVAALKDAISLREDDATAHLNLGTVLREKKLPAEAVPVLQKALRLRPDDFLTLMSLAEALHEKGSDDEARGIYREAFDRRPRHAQVLLDLGATLRNRGLPDEALTAFREAAQLKPDLADAHASVGDELHAKGRFAEAIPAYREAIWLKPDYPMAHYKLGTALAATRSFEEAVAHYQEAVRLRPAMVDAYLALGAVLCDETRDYDGAIKAFEQAIRLLEAERTRAGALGGATAALIQAVLLQPDNHAAHDNLGNALWGKGDHDGAIKAYREAIRLKPDNAESHRKLGDMYAAKQQYEDAVAAYGEAIRRKPDLFEAHFGLGRALVAKRAPEEAVGAFQAAARLKPGDAQCQFTLAEQLAAVGRHDEAEKVYARAVTLWRKRAAEPSAQPADRSQLGAVLNNFAMLLTKRNKPAEAARLLEEAVVSQKAALEIDPKNPRYRQFLRNHYRNLTDAWLALGDHAAAARAAAEPPRLFPDSWREHFWAVEMLVHCIHLAQEDAGLPETKRRELTQTYAGAVRRHAREAVKWGGNDPNALDSLAWFLANSPGFRAPPLAVELARQAVELAPREGEYWTTLGAAHYRAGDWNGAVKALEEATARRKGGDGAGWFFLAMAHWKLGDKEEARRWYHRASEWMEKNKPGDEELRFFRDEAAQLLGIEKKDN